MAEGQARLDGPIPKPGHELATPPPIPTHSAGEATLSWGLNLLMGQEGSGGGGDKGPAAAPVTSSRAALRLLTGLPMSSPLPSPPTQSLWW